jgi:hypothetical protein
MRREKESKQQAELGGRSSMRLPSAFARAARGTRSTTSPMPCVVYDNGASEWCGEVQTCGPGEMPRPRRPALGADRLRSRFLFFLILGSVRLGVCNLELLAALRA